MAKVNIRIKDIDRGWIGLVKNVAGIGRTYVQVGFQAGDKADERVHSEDGSSSIVRSDVDVALIAAWNEFGTENSPSRPFMRNTAEKKAYELSKRIAAEKKAIFAGKKTIYQSLALLGMWYQTQVQLEMRNGEYAPNAPYTIKQKKSDRPLFDTGRMWQSVRYVVKASL